MKNIPVLDTVLILNSPCPLQRPLATVRCCSLCIIYTSSSSSCRRMNATSNTDYIQYMSINIQPYPIHIWCRGLPECSRRDPQRQVGHCWLLLFLLRAPPGCWHGRQDHCPINWQQEQHNIFLGILWVQFILGRKREWFFLFLSEESFDFSLFDFADCNSMHGCNNIMGRRKIENTSRPVCLQEFLVTKKNNTMHKHKRKCSCVPAGYGNSVPYYNQKSSTQN